jgi:hypothetical protein
MRNEKIKNGLNEAGNIKTKLIILCFVTFLIIGASVIPSVNAVYSKNKVMNNDIDSLENRKASSGSSSCIEIKDPEAGYVYINGWKSPDKNSILEALNIALLIPFGEMFINTEVDPTCDIAYVYFKIVGYLLGDEFDGYDYTPNNGFSFIWPKDTIPVYRFWSMYVYAYNSDDNLVGQDESTWPLGDGAAFT